MRVRLSGELVPQQGAKVPAPESAGPTLNTPSVASAGSPASAEALTGVNPREEALAQRTHQAVAAYFTEASNAVGVDVAASAEGWAEWARLFGGPEQPALLLEQLLRGTSEVPFFNGPPATPDGASSTQLEAVARSLAPAFSAFSNELRGAVVHGEYGLARSHVALETAGGASAEVDVVYLFRVGPDGKIVEMYNAHETGPFVEAGLLQAEAPRPELPVLRALNDLKDRLASPEFEGLTARDLHSAIAARDASIARLRPADD